MDVPHGKRTQCPYQGDQLVPVGAVSVLAQEVPPPGTFQVLKVKIKHPRNHTPSPRQTMVVGHPSTELADSSVGITDGMEINHVLKSGKSNKNLQHFDRIMVVKPRDVG